MIHDIPGTCLSSILVVAPQIAPMALVFSTLEWVRFVRSCNLHQDGER